MSHFFEMQERRKAQIDMPKVIAFALFSTRRHEEIKRIRWDDLDDSRQALLVRDMKNPGQKIGNDVRCHLPDEVWVILQSMPKVEREIFPYNAKSVSASFTRARPMLGIEVLHFHALRHEGVSRLFDIDWDIPRGASVRGGHRDWSSLRRYTHLGRRGGPYAGWKWMDRIKAG